MSDSWALPENPSVSSRPAKPLPAPAVSEAARACEVLTKVVAGCVHDFNNLLTVILGVTELRLPKLAPDDPIHADLLHIAHAAERGISVTRRLGGMSRPGWGPTEIVDVNLRLSRMDGVLRRVAGNAVEYMLVPALSVRPVKVPAAAFDDVLVQLVADAGQSMPHGGTVRVETRDSIARVEISVSDAGLDARGSRRSGLERSRPIVAGFGGDIEVERGGTRGTTVRVSLPAADPEEARATPPAPPRKSARGSETVLLQEDDPGVRRVCSGALQAFGYRVLEAAKADEALALASRRQDAPIGLLVTGLMPAGSDGPALYRSLRLRVPGLRVLYLSGSSGSDVAALDGIADEPVLNKPFSPRRLALWVRAVLDGVPPEAWGA